MFPRQSSRLQSVDGQFTVSQAVLLQLLVQYIDDWKNKLLVSGGEIIMYLSLRQLRRKRRYERDKLSMSVRKRQLEIITRWRFMLDSNSEPCTILLPYSHSLKNVQQRS